MGREFSYKTIDTLQAEVPSDDGDRTETFQVRMGRYANRRRGGPQLGEPDTDRVEFVIENVALAIKASSDTLHGAKAELRKLLVKKENFSGKWTLWMHVEATGAFDHDASHYDCVEKAHATIEASFHLELVTKTPQGDRTRHMRLKQTLPQPFVGEFWVPTTHAEHQDLREGPAFKRQVEDWVDHPTKKEFNGRPVRTKVLEEQPEVWVEATPESVETVRALQRKLGEMGEKVQAAMAKKNFHATLEAVRKGSLAMLGPGAR